MSDKHIGPPHLLNLEVLEDRNVPNTIIAVGPMAISEGVNTAPMAHAGSAGCSPDRTSNPAEPSLERPPAETRQDRSAFVTRATDESPPSHTTAQPIRVDQLTIPPDASDMFGSDNASDPLAELRGPAEV